MLKYLIILAIIVDIYAFVDCAMTPQENVRKVPKWGWLLIILFTEIFGAILAISGLLISLFTRQRRIWVKQGKKTQIAGLAKNGIPGLEDEINDLVKELSNE